MSDTLSAFLRARLAKRYATTPRWKAAVDEASAAADPAPSDEETGVTVVDDRAPAPGPARRVVHPKFGEGAVVREIEGDKLEIAFDRAGTKTLHRSFVRDL